MPRETLFTYPYALQAAIKEEKAKLTTCVITHYERKKNLDSIIIIIIMIKTELCLLRQNKF